MAKEWKIGAHKKQRTFLIPLMKSELPDRLGRDTSIKLSSSLDVKGFGSLALPEGWANTTIDAETSASNVQTRNNWKERETSL